VARYPDPELFIPDTFFALDLTTIDRLKSLPVLGEVLVRWQVQLLREE
jgi:hypothetical protein